MPSLSLFRRLSLVALVCGLSATSLHAQGFSQVVAFGDSLSDEGNTIELLRAIGQMEMAEYDEVYYTAESYVHGVKYEANGRFSNGPTWVEYLNGKIVNGGAAQQPLALGRNDGGLHPFGTNFSWAGSTAHTTGSKLPGTGLNDQISNYAGQTFLTSQISTTLFTLWSGGNDAINWVKSSTLPTPPEDLPSLAAVTDQAVAGIVTALTSLHNMGALNVIVPNLPALGFKPDFRLDPLSRDLANDFAEMFNDKLGLAISSLSLNGLNIIEIDIYSIFEDIRLNPEDYGFTNATGNAYTFHDPESGPGESTIEEGWEGYVFWDNTHPSTKVHEILGNAAFNALPIPEPSTYVLMGAGAALGLGLLRRRRAA